MPQQLQLLGGFRCYHQDSWLEPPLNQAAAFLAYLGYEGDWLRRERLLTFLWPDASEQKARQSLRALLYKCKKIDWAELEVTDTHVRWSVISDVSQFQEACSQADWAAAISTYKGTFLETYQGTISAPFDDWLEQTRSELHANWRDVALPIAREFNGQGQFLDSIRLLEAVFTYDDLAEDILQVYMQSLALAGQNAKALSIFERFCGKLACDLGMNPLEDSLELAEAIRQGRLQQARVHQHDRQTNNHAPEHVTGLVHQDVTDPVDVAGMSQATTAIPFDHQLAPLPQPQTAFVGRTLDLLELANRLTDTRLITLLGPGGVGKSRLALALLEQQQQNYRDGVIFVPLATVQATADIPDAIAGNLQLTLSGINPVLEDVCDYLADKHMLIVLDNVEHLLAGVQDVIQRLACAPTCHIVTTSRVLLGLPGESVYDVVGLSLPTLNTGQDYSEAHLDAYDATNLFLRSARRVRSDFALHAGDQQALVELCQLLEGMPLALELAASWVRLYSLPELVSALKQDMDLLEADGQQVSARHRSMRQVFLSSWQQLSAEEKRVLAALSVFCGGFELVAARAVTGASARTLLRLVNRSLLRTTALGRFSMLEVIRQYAAEQLVDTDQVARAHYDYYLTLIRKQNFRSNAPEVPLSTVDADFDNIRSAWRYALRLAPTEVALNLKDFVAASNQVNFYLDLRARFREGISLFQEGIDVFRQDVFRQDVFKQASHDATLGALVLNQALLYRWVGDLDTTAELATQALSLLAKSDDYINQIAAYYSLSDCAEHAGDSEAARHHLHKAGKLVETHGTAQQQRALLKERALLEHTLGNFELAQTLYAEALHAYQQVNDQIGIAEMFNHWGQLKLEQGDARNAQTMLEQALTLIHSYGDDAYAYMCHADLGACALALGELDHAETQYMHAIRLAQQNNSATNIADYTADYARVKLAQDQPRAAFELLQQSLSSAWQLHNSSTLLYVFLAWAEYFLQDGEPLASALVSCVVQHQASSKSVKRRARNLITRYGLEVDETTVLSDLECLAPHVTQLASLSAT
ncbi:MAG: AAA family ATPase [Deinococcota bacterium]